MEFTKLGHTDIEVSRICLGCMSFGKAGEYSCAMKSHFRKFGNQMSGSGNHLCKFTLALIYPSHKPHAWICHAQH